MDRKPQACYGWFLCGLAGLFFLYQYILRVAPSVMEHEVRVAYHMTASSFGNVTALFYYVYAPMQLVVGVLLDRYSLRYLLSLALLSCSLGMVLYASGDPLWLMAVGRALVGFGASFAFIGALKVSVEWLPKRSFSFIAGLTYAIGMVGGVIGDLVLTHLVQIQGWKLACLYIACFGVVLSLLLFLSMSKQSVQEIKKNSLNYADFRQGLMRVFKTPSLWLAGIIAALLLMPLAGFTECWQIPYLSKVDNYSRSDAAAAAASVFAGCAMGAPLICYLAEQLKQQRVLLTMGCVLSTVIISYAIYVPELPKHVMMSLFFFYGLFSSVVAVVFLVSRNFAPEGYTGTAFSLVSTLMMSSGVIIVIVGILLDFISHEPLVGGLHHYTEGDFQMAFLVFPIGLIMATFLSFFLEDG